MRSLYCLWVCAFVLSYLSPVYGQTAKNGDTALFTITKLSAKSVDNDPWGPMPFSENIRGQAVYDMLTSTRMSDGKYHVENDIFVRRVTKNSSDGTPTIYHIQRKNGGAAYSPQFSPDGRYVLLKFGGLGLSTLPFQMYVLDLRTGKVQLLKNPTTGEAYSPVFIEVRWSPDDRYLAWVEGVDIYGSRLEQDQPAQLRLCDWRTGRSRVVASNDAVSHSFSWGVSHTLVYSVLPNNQTRPISYEVDASKGEPHLLFQDAYRTVISPSGKQVAFFGSSPTQPLKVLHDDWRNVFKSDFELCTATRDGSTRHVISIEKTPYPDVAWQRNEHHLLTLQQTVESPQSQAEVRRYDVTTNQFKLLAVLNANDIEPVHRIVSEPQFQILSLSPDDRTLYVSTSEMVGNNASNTSYVERKSVVAVDLIKGSTTTVAQTETALGLDWHDQTP